MKVALALGGGAGLGWAHIGVLRALHDRGVAVDAVAGTSIGALAAACFAADRLEVLETLARGVNLRGVMGYIDFRMGRGSVLGGRRIARELRGHFGELQLDALRIPCAVVAADLVSGTEHVMTTGSLVDGVRASIAIPGVLPPVLRDGLILVDGGVTSPVPVAAVRRLSSSPVLAINLQGDYLRRSAAMLATSRRDLSTIRVSRTAISMLMMVLAKKSLAIDPPDLELAPAVGLIDIANFSRGNDLIAIGRAAVDGNWDAIARVAA